MKRRRVLASLGGAVGLGLAGCLGSSNSGSTTETSTGAGAGAGAGGQTATESGTQESTVADGYPPQSAIGEKPSQPAVDPSTFDTVTSRGTEVPLVPIDVAYDWYRRREARFADARGSYSYDAAHVLGAVLSPAPNGQDRSDPITAWPKSDRIVTYCGCPHHLSSMRAGTLINAGYENVYALDEGFSEWFQREYPMAGEKVSQRQNLSQQPGVHVIQGRTPRSDAGEAAWARHEPTGQREAGPIAIDGSYELKLKFWDVTPESVVTVKTPSYTISAQLQTLTSGRVTPEDANLA